MSQTTSQNNSEELKVALDSSIISHEMIEIVSPQKTRIQIVKELFAEFCSNSSIHGTRYFTSYVHRIWWIPIFVLSAILCAFAVRGILSDWYENPVKLTYTNEVMPVGDIPFPAVTICSTIKFRNGLMNDNITFVDDSKAGTFNGIDQRKLNILDAILQLCRNEDINLDGNVTIPRTESIYKTIADIVPGRKSLLKTATFLDEPISFEPLFMRSGICYSFNLLNSKDVLSDEVDPELMTIKGNPDNTWIRSRGYPSEEYTNDYPRRMFGAGWHNSFFAVLGTPKDGTSQYCNEKEDPGFLISLHLPDEKPYIIEEFTFIPPEHEAYFSIKPNMITTSRGLRHYSPEVRRCFYTYERKLRFFKIYNRSNCIRECFSNYLQSRCGCIVFSATRGKETKACTMRNIKCYKRAMKVFSTDNNHIKTCNCLPNCFSITYDVDVSLMPFYNSKKNGRDLTSNVTLSYKDSYFIPIQRNPTYTLSSLMADFGGLLGLFMGMSVLNIVEFIYYFSIRLLFILRKQKLLQVPSSNWTKLKNYVLTMKNHAHNQPN